jgi:RNA polymerase sigma-70 factor (ECF subfamily)
LAEAMSGRLEDRSAREAFVEATYVELYRWFCRLTGSADRAADLTQDSYLALWGALDRLPPGVSYRTWLFAIGRNLWRKGERDRKSFDPIVSSLVEEETPPVDASLLGQEFREAALAALGQMPDELREVFTLRFWHELGYDEIGQIQGITADLARWRYFAARKRLHQLLAAWNPTVDRRKEDRHAT